MQLLYRLIVQTIESTQRCDCICYTTVVGVVLPSDQLSDTLFLFLFTPFTQNLFIVLLEAGVNHCL